MPDQTTIRADQIEGLPDLIIEKVREVLREEVKPTPEDMDQLRRSPAGAMIRLESKVEALDEKVDHRFDALESEVDQRFDALRGEMNQRFEAVDQRFEAVDQRFEAVDQRFDTLESKMDQRFDALRGEMNQRFVDQKESMDGQFSTMKWVFVLIFPLLFTILGKLFLTK